VTDRTYFTDDNGLDVLAVFGDDISARLDHTTGQWVQSPVGLDAAFGESSSMSPITEAEAATIAAGYGGTLPVRALTPSPIPRE
jgi:hypothetical protein